MPRYVMTVFDQLETAWVADPATRCAVPTWTDEALAGRPPQALVAAAHRGGDRDSSERVARALVGRARTDDLAALTLLHMFLPASKAVARRLTRLSVEGAAAGGSFVDARERAMMVVDELFRVLRTYPCHRRGSVWGNVMGELVGGLLRPVARGRYLEVDLYDPCPAWENEDGSDDEVGDKGCPAIFDQAPVVTLHPPGRSAGEEVLELLAETVRTGRLAVEDARLIAESRLGQADSGQLAAAAGMGVHTWRRRRQRAEARLRTAALAA